MINARGRKFMKKYDSRGELAPRDIVARAIDSELKEHGDENVFLDISHKDSAFIKKRFPNIYRECRRRGFDITKNPIPVVPSAHYNCGGVVADIHGRTDIEGLYACGESAFTGMHGANRLASNSLLEAVVMSDYAADDAAAFLNGGKFPEVPPAREWLHSSINRRTAHIVVPHDRMILRRLMSDFVGIVRSSERLSLALERSRMILKAADIYYFSRPASYAIVELRNMALVANLIIRSASRRKESRGLHFVIDLPKTDDDHWLKNTIIRPSNYQPLRRKNG